MMLNFLGISAQEVVQDNLAASTDSVAPIADSLRASLITCTPGTDVYAHFGHTAIRITNLADGSDYIFNYGCFDMSGANFVMKFIKGETDYIVAAEDASYFFHRYSSMGNGVSEQVLNLTQAECMKLADLLFTNILPGNRGYRYNWLYDNCTTRARDMIVKAIDGKVEYRNQLPSLTARDELHECLSNNSWLELGIDLMLGTEIDTLAPRNIQQFIPAHYANDLDSTIIIDAEGKERVMVSENNQILVEQNQTDTDTWLTPQVVLALLLIITIALTIYEYRAKKTTLWLDIILHTVQGIAGIIIAYLFFFSVHPAVSTNWQVIIFNPLYIIYAVYLTYCAVKKKDDKLIHANLSVIIIFYIVSRLAHQSLNPAVDSLALILLIRAVMRSIVIRFTKK